MTQQQDKNESARLQFEEFKKLCKCIPPGEVKVWENTGNDPPDISIGNNKLGIEFVNFYHGSKSDRGSEIKANEEKFARIIKCARDEFEKGDKTPLSVRCLWKNDARPKKSEEKEIVQELVKLVKKSISPFSNLLIPINQDSFIGTCLQSYLERMSVTNLSTVGESSWANDKSLNTYVGIAELEECVREKETDLYRYIDKFNQLWLVIVASSEFNSISTYAILNQTVVPGCITSQFDRVYFFNRQFDIERGHIICLTGDKNEVG